MMKTAMERVGIVGAGMTGATVASLLRSECADSKLVVLDKGRGVGKNIGIIFFIQIPYASFPAAVSSSSQGFIVYDPLRSSLCRLFTFCVVTTWNLYFL